MVPWPGVTVRCLAGGGTGLDNTTPSKKGLPAHDYRVTVVIGMFGLCPDGTVGDDDQGAQGCQQFGEHERAAMVEVLSDVLTIDEVDPHGKIPEFKFCAVRVTPAGAPGQTNGTS